MFSKDIVRTIWEKYGVEGVEKYLFSMGLTKDEVHVICIKLECGWEV